jgi:pyruvate formate lyase activating enzyme
MLQSTKLTVISGRFFNQISNDTVQCELCPRRCVLPEGKAGSCKVRFNHGGKGEIPYYGYITARALDPIEKKPLYHFRPGSRILSLGFAGCNLHCPFCQNWHISQSTDANGQVFSAAEIIDAVKKSTETAQPSIAYTYSEPLVHIEFLLDCMKEAHKAGIANVLVSNGCINSGVAAEILPLTDAANIDLKSFSEETYKKVLGGDLKTVTAFISMAVEKGVHLELTTLIVTSLNDSKAELEKCRDFIAELETGESYVPWHLSAYHPDYKWQSPATSPQAILAAVKVAKEKLSFVYAGNIIGDNDTFCPFCGKKIIGRRGYKIDMSGLSIKTEKGIPTYYCANCGEKAPVKP